MRAFTAGALSGVVFGIAKVQVDGQKGIGRPCNGRRNWVGADLAVGRHIGSRAVEPRTHGLMKHSPSSHDLGQQYQFSMLGLAPPGRRKSWPRQRHDM